MDTLIDAEPGRYARVALDLPLPHLDRLFDYSVPAEFDAAARPGVRIRARFAGRLRDGFLIERTTTSEVDRVAPLHAVVSDLPVLTPEVRDLVRAVADHCAGTFSDVVRLAVPPRHAATEKEPPRGPAPVVEGTPAELLATTPAGKGWLESVSRGEGHRAFWQVPATATGPGWAAGLAEAAAATAAARRGALLIVPDARDLALLAEQCTAAVGADDVVALRADLGPSARYRAFLRVLRGEVRVVIGTRSALFAPVADLGLVALWDDGDDLLAEPRAPYPHARDVLALRSVQSGAALLMASHSRSVEVQQWLEQDWLRPIEHPVRVRRTGSPAIRIAAEHDSALRRDPLAAAARLPHEAFGVLRAGLATGPVLVQVPRSGYQLALTCQRCRTPVVCPHCHGRVQAPRGGSLRCQRCARPLTDWRCPECGSVHWRAPVVGAERTAEEFGRAFPQTPVIRSSGDQVRTEVPDEPSLVIATPGGEPRAEGGYAAAVLLDADLALLRADLRAEEEALRRWLNATALVRGGADGGSVLLVGATGSRVAEALVRLDPGWSAAGELADRRAAAMPPAVRMVVVEGDSDALATFVAAFQAPASTTVLGPVPGPGEESVHRLLLSAPLAEGRVLVRAVKDAVSVRSARKDPGSLRVKVDPVAFG